MWGVGKWCAGIGDVVCNLRVHCFGFGGGYNLMVRWWGRRLLEGFRERLGIGEVLFG